MLCPNRGISVSNLEIGKGGDDPRVNLKRCHYKDNRVGVPFRRATSSVRFGRRGRVLLFKWRNEAG